MEHTQLMVVAADPAVRQKLMAVVEFVEGFHVVAETGSGPDALETARRVKPHVILLEVGETTQADFDLVGQMREVVPGLVVVVTASSAQPDDIRLALKAGAKDFLVMPFSNDTLIESLQCAAIEAHRNARMLRPQPTHGGEALQDVDAHRGKIYSVTALKGGVGRTSIAVNLAIALVRATDKRVCVVDFDLQKGDVAIMLNMHAVKTMVDLCESGPPWTSEDCLGYCVPHESGIEALLAPSRPEQAESVTAEHVAEILPLLQEEFDYILVDTASKISDLELTIFDLSYRIFNVVNLELPAIKNGKALLELLHVLRYPKERIALILNQGFPALQGIDVDSVQTGLRREVYGLLPSAGSEVVRALSKGRPFQMQSTPTDLTRAYETLAQKIAQDLLAG